MLTEYELYILEEFNRLSLEQPKSLFKYMDIDGGVKCLESCNIKFTSPLNFTDLTECRLSRFDMQRYYQDTFLRLSKDLSDNVIKIGDQNAWDKYNFFLTMDSEERNEMLLRMTNETIKSFGICCLTHRFDNDRMWSDYANNGNGICIEYDSQMLINELKKYFRKLNAPYMTGKTLYIDEIERVHYYLGDVSGEGDDDFFKMSAINWMFVKEQEKYQFEEEYRFVFPVFSHNESGFSLVNVSPNVVKKVLIGQRVSSSNREKIIHLIKRKYYGKPDIVYI